MLKFMYLDVKDELATELKKAVVALGLEPIRVLKSDPKDPAEIPCIGINRANDDEASQVIGDDLGEVYDEVLARNVSYKGTFFNETIEVRLWHKNADERDKLYIIIKAVLVDMRNALVAKGLRNLVLRGGRDEQENSFPPYPLYWATITLNYLNPLSIEIQEAEDIGGEVISFQTILTPMSVTTEL